MKQILFSDTLLLSTTSFIECSSLCMYFSPYIFGPSIRMREKRHLLCTFFCSTKFHLFRKISIFQKEIIFSSPKLVFSKTKTVKTGKKKYRTRVTNQSVSVLCFVYKKSSAHVMLRNKVERDSLG